MRQLTVGILAHVDAGKTTLSESILYHTGSIRRLGRVDDRDAFLDNYELEKSRGITIFSKQALFDWGDYRVTLLDTPGHVDFSAEMERTLQVLDYAILVISGADGVQSHTRTLYRLLERYNIPVFLFINKMDQPGTNREKLMEELQHSLSDGCVDFTVGRDMVAEAAAMCEEELLERYLEHGEVGTGEIRRLIRQRKLFPCYFGSALKMQGVEEFLQGLGEYTESTEFGEKFGAKVYKITRDEQGNRFTHMKITGGRLKVRQMLSGRERGGSDGEWTEKVNQIRIYSGEKFEAVSEAEAGMICAVTGLTRTYPGGGLGCESESDMPILEPVLTYRILLPEDCDPGTVLPKLRQLEEEEPELHIIWNEALREIHAQLMGEVQIEILKQIIWERYHIQTEFGSGSILYKETIADPVIGVGHFEPLRHYAEVHLLLEPGEEGSGLQFAADCSEDVLDKNWQRLILTHLEEKEHCGVLSGSPVTDMKITVVAGRAHQKHTEGGDFRQATYRAVRQALRKAESVLLEPYYEFRLELPTEQIGRAMNDIERMYGSLEPLVTEGEEAVLSGTAPVAAMREYQKEVTAYSGGRGRLFCSLKGYSPCHNTDEVLEQMQYDADADMENPADSVFCAHGAGFLVKWDQVEEYMHVKDGYSFLTEDVRQEEDAMLLSAAERRRRGYVDDYALGEEEINEILGRTYRANQSPKKGWTLQRKRTVGADAGSVGKQPVSRKKSQEKYLLVDGYNIVFAWDELRELAEDNIDAARGRLMDILCNYQAYQKDILILVFDAYRVKGNLGQMTDYYNIHVVYTKEAETADQYIEKLAHKMGRDYDVTVATSDGLEQLIIRGQGCKLLSARDLKAEIDRVEEVIRTRYLEQQKDSPDYLSIDGIENEWSKQ